MGYNNVARFNSIAVFNFLRVTVIFNRIILSDQCFGTAIHSG